MMRYKFLIKAIDEYTKCKATAQALKIGSTGVWGYLRNEDGRITGSTLTYDNGTTLKYDENGKLEEMTYNGETLSYMSNQREADEFFKDQKEKLIEKYGQEAYDNFSQFAYMYHTSMHEPINTSMREKSISYLKEYMEKTMRFDKEDCDFIISNADGFESMLEGNDLSDYPSFFTIRGVGGLYDTEKITKKIVHDKGFNSQSVGMSSVDIMDIFGVDYDTDESGWLIVTPYMSGNNMGKGAYIETAIGDGYAQIYGDSYESGELEFLAPPNQSFMRTIIDTDNRIIIQEPYEP